MKRSPRKWQIILNCVFPDGVARGSDAYWAAIALAAPEMTIFDSTDIFTALTEDERNEVHTDILWYLFSDPVMALPDTVDSAYLEAFAQRIAACEDEP